MALAASIFEYRSTGLTTNGGGFVIGGTGTDKSQTDSPAYSFTDLASTSGTTVPAIVTSASHSFDSTDVGNILHINSGTSWIVGLYQIVSVSGGAATLDKACGSLATLSAGTYSVGGALNTGSATTDSSMFASFIPIGSTIYFKKGNYTLGQLISGRVASAANPISIIGYKTTRGDNPTAIADQPFIDTVTFGWIIGVDTHMNYLTMTAQNASATLSTTANQNIVECNISVTGASTGLTALACPGGGVIIKGGSYSSLRGFGITISGSSGTHVLGARIFDCATGISLNTTGQGNTIVENLIEGCYTNGILFGSSVVGNYVNGNTIFGSNTPQGTGINLPNGASRTLILNNNISGWTTGIANANAVNSDVSDYNNFFNNTADRSGSAPTGAHDTAINPAFVNVGQITGTTATVAAGGVLTDSSANFANVVVGQDGLYMVSGTSATVGKYQITAKTTTTLTLFPAPTTNAVADKSYRITTGHNFNVGVALQGIAYPVTFSGLTTSFGDIGGVQRNPTADYTDPGLANVKIGIGYLYGSVSETGTYDGSDRWSDPGVANVLSTATYNANNVGKTGTYVGVSTGNVKTGTSYGAASALTGTYDGSDRWTDPGVANVRLTTVYKANSVSNNRTGTLDLPATTDTKINVVFDNTTKTGSYDGSDRWSVLNVADVRTGLPYKNNSPTNNEVGIYAPVALPQILKNNFNIDASNNLNGALWVDRDSAIITASLGDASYEIFNPDGTTTHISEGPLSDASGLYFITPVDVTALLGTDNYLLKVSIEVDSVVYSTYVSLDLAPGGPTAAQIADAVWEEDMSGHTTSGTFGWFTQKLLTVGKFLGLQ